MPIFPFTEKFGAKLPSSAVAIIDTETTGVLEQGRARVVELAAAKVNPRTGEISSRFSTIINPGLHNIFKNPSEALRRHRMGLVNLGNLPQDDPDVARLIHPELLEKRGRRQLHAFEINKISPLEIMEKGVSQRAARKQFSQWMSREGIEAAGAYNIPFDKRMMARLGLNRLPWHANLDIMKHATGITSPLGYARYSFTRKKWSMGAEEAARLFIDPDIVETHRALADVELESRVLGAMADTENPIIKEFQQYQAGHLPTRMKAAGRRAMRYQEAFSRLVSQEGVVPAFKKILPNLGHLGPFGKGAIFTGGLIAAGAILEPLRYISGKDDDYNTIEGLPHGGVAQNLRQYFTEFGSGYQGIIKRLIFGTADKAVEEAAERLTRSVAHTFPEAEGIELALETAAKGKRAGQTAMTIRATRGEEELFVMERMFDPTGKSLDLTKIEVVESLRGKARGVTLPSGEKLSRYQILSEAEQNIYANYGLSGWTVTSLAHNPVTAARIEDLYRAQVKGDTIELVGQVPVSRHRIRQSKMAQMQKEAQIGLSVNAYSGGHQHNIPMNKRRK